MLEDQIEAIMAQFDFRRVRKCMKLMDWKWAPCFKVPSMNELRKTARDMLEEVSKMPAGSRVATGGFWAFMISENHLVLQFSVASLDGKEED